MGALSPVTRSTWSLLASQSFFNPTKGQRTIMLRRPRFVQFDPKTPFCQVRADDERQSFQKIKVQIPHNESSAILCSLLAEIQSPYIWTTVVPAA
jgi:hypothetical protein